MNIVAHNLIAINTNRQFGIVTKNKTKSSEKLTSGYRINQAADDAAGLAISEKMRRQIRGLTQGVVNTQDGVSLCQVADGALAEVNDMLHRITELSVKSANGTNSEQDRQYIQEEISQILQEIDRIGETTTFNERKIFDGNTIQQSYLPITVGKLEVVQQTLPSNPVPTTYHITADRSGFAINGDVRSWGNFVHENGVNCLSDSQIVGGTYSYTYDGFSLSIEVDDNADFADIIGRLDGASFETQNLPARDLKDSFEFTDICGLIGVDQEITDSTNVILRADTDGMWIEIDGTQYGGKISWRYGSGLDEQGSDYWNHDAFFASSGGSGSYGIIDFCEKAADPYCRPTASMRVTETISKTNAIDVLDGSRILLDTTNPVAPGTTVSFASIWNPSVTAENTTYNYRFLGLELTSCLVSAGISTSIKQTDYIGQTAQQGNEKVLNIWIQSGCEVGDGMYLSIDRMDTDVLGIQYLDISTVDGAKHALDAVKGALSKVLTNRAKIGAQQNRLEHTIANEENVVENTTAAESRIRDTDMAKEMVHYSNLNILEQVTQAMMAQTNQSNQGVLTLLGS